MIEVNNISKHFKKPIRQPGFLGMVKTMFSTKKEIINAVDDISFRINDGEIVGYIGSNGAGKSTTIKMMSGILTPTSGSILLNGLEPYVNKNRSKVLKDVGVVFGQRTQLWWDLPLIETFNLYKDIYEISDADFKERFDYLCKVLDIDKFLNNPVRTLSLGQRMRADLAASLIHNPKILFLDEPTIGLDVLVKEKITEAIIDINKKYNTTVILTTHDMTDIIKLCKRVVIIDEGHILYDGLIADLKSKFGDIKHISVQTVSPINFEKIETDFNGLLKTEQGDISYTNLYFDGQKITTKEILNYLLSHYDITDIKISENELSEVVKRIYESKKV